MNYNYKNRPRNGPLDAWIPSTFQGHALQGPFLGRAVLSYTLYESAGRKEPAREAASGGIGGCCHDAEVDSEGAEDGERESAKTSSLTTPSFSAMFS